MASLTDARVRVFTQSRQGQQAAAHLGMSSTNAEYVARMDSDDVASPNRLEKQVAYLDKHLDVGLVGTQITRRGDRGFGLTSHLPTEHDQIVDDLMHNRHSMCNPSTMLRRKLYFAVGGYWNHNIAEDWDLFLRLAEVSKLANLEEPLLSYRFHSGSINGRRIVEAQLYNEYAAHLARLRASGEAPVSYEAFLAKHRSRTFPSSVFFPSRLLLTGPIPPCSRRSSFRSTHSRLHENGLCHCLFTQSTVSSYSLFLCGEVEAWSNRSRC